MTIREYNHKGVKGKSLTTTDQLKSEYLEIEVIRYKKHGLSISHAEIVNKRFKVSVSEFWSMEVTNDMINYVRLMKGSFNNNVRLV